MDFIQLNSFATVVECGSFSRAAEKMHMAHSTVTGHVQRLEQELDCILIKRNTRTMVLTDRGQVVYRFAKQSIGSKFEMEAELNRMDTSYRINMASTSCISFGVIPPILAKYRRKNNAIFNLIQGQDKEIQMLLCSGLISLGFVRKPYQGKDVECVLLGRSSYKLLVPKDGVFANIMASAADPADLALEYPMVLATKGEDTRTRIENRWLERFGARPPMPFPVVETFGVESVVNHVQAGLGFTLVPNFVAKRTENDAFVRILEIEKETLDPAEIYLLYRKTESNQAVLDFIQFVRSWAQRNGDLKDIAYFE